MGKEEILIFFGKISEGVHLLAQQMIDNPLEWVQGPYEFVNTKNPDIRIWTPNGVSYIKINGNDCLSYAEKRHIAAAIKKAIARRLMLTSAIKA